MAGKREPDTNVCPKCGFDGSWGTASWCPQCGYYPGVTDGICEVVRESQVDENPAPKKHLLPVWVKILLGGLAAVGAISVLAKYYFYYYGGNIGLWTISQFFIGLAMVLGAQILTTIVAIKSGSQDSLLDGFTNPIEVWRPTLETLPRGSRRICSFAWGLLAAILAIALIGGIDYSAMWGEPVKRPRSSQTNLVHEFVAESKQGAEARQDGEESDLENAMNDFVGAATSDENEPLPPADRPLRCVVYGYMKDGRRDFGRVLIAARIQGEWKHVAIIPADGLSSDVRRELAGQFQPLSREEPLVTGPFAGTWVEPNVGLEVSFDGWTDSRSMISPVFERLLRRDVEAPLPNKPDSSVPQPAPPELPATAG